MTFGWCIALVSIVAIPAGAVHTLVMSSEKTLFEVDLELINSFNFVNSFLF
jgi:hypothetical protein